MIENQRYSFVAENFAPLYNHLEGDANSMIVYKSIDALGFPSICIYHFDCATLALERRHLDIFAGDKKAIQKTKSKLEEIAKVKLKE